MEVPSRLVDEGQAAESRNPLIGGQLTVDLLSEGFGIGVGDFPTVEVGVRDSGTMSE
jgi:hypothetical protein